MTKDWVKANLAPHIEQRTNDQGEQVDVIVLERTEAGVQYIEVDKFITHFGHVPDVATNAKLKTEDKGKGFSRFFDKWRDEGLLG